MRAYLATSGTIFGLLVLAHGLRVVEEGMAVADSPWFVVVTAAAGGLCAWAVWLLRSSARL